jgi:hypothetical protein
MNNNDSFSLFNLYICNVKYDITINIIAQALQKNNYEEKNNTFSTISTKNR